MDLSKKKFSGSREPSKKKPSLGWVIVLAAAGGAVIGSAATHFFSKPQPAPMQPASSLLGEIPKSQTVTMPPAQQYTPAPQPPGEAPPGKVWSPEHGHWHDAPAPSLIPEPTPPAPETPLAPAPAVVPPEKKE